MNQIVTSNPIQLVETHGEPTVRDVDLGAWLEMKRPTHVRRIIENNRAELEEFGGLYFERTNPGAAGGRPSVEFHLSEEQALAVCQLAKTPKAREVRFGLIKVFTAYRRGHLVPELTPSSVGGILKSVLLKALDDRIPEMIEARMAQDPRIAAVDAVPALQVVLDKKVSMKGRRRIVQRVSNSLARFCEARRDYHVTRDWSGRRLFPRGAVNEWLATGGWGPIRELIEYMGGQQYLKLIPKSD